MKEYIIELTRADGSVICEEFSSREEWQKRFSELFGEGGFIFLAKICKRETPSAGLA